MSEFHIYVQSWSLQDLSPLTVGALRENNWQLPDGLLVRIHQHNLPLGKNSVRVTLRSVISESLDPRPGHYVMEREILEALHRAPAHLIPLRRVREGRTPDAIWWLSQSPSEAFWEKAIPSIELCEIVSVTTIAGAEF
jgi:hypothetical protein